MIPEILQSLFIVFMAIISASVLCLALGGVLWKAAEPKHEADDSPIERVREAMEGKGK